MRAVVFDFDGVLADSMAINYLAKKQLFLPFGFKLSKEEFIRIWINPESREKEGNKYYVKLHGINVAIEELREKQKPIFESIFLEKSRLMPGALGLLRSLRKKGVPLGIVSSNYRYSIGIVLHKFSLERDFDFVIAAGDCENPKPHPEPYILAAKKFGCSPGEVLALEDSANGVQSAKAAGCKCIAIPNKFTAAGDFSRADAVVKRFSEINEALLEKIAP